MPETKLPKRFYDAVSLDEASGGFTILLDGKKVRTPARADLTVASRALAEELVREWDAQKKHIDPASMPMTKRANTALDRVRGREEEVVKEIVDYAGADLLCYRAENPEGLVELQNAHWDRVLEWAREDFGPQFRVEEGISHFAQSRQSLDQIRSVFAIKSFFELTPLHTITTLTGSALLALAHAHGFLSADELWAAANVDEDWQISKWGEDAEAVTRRKIRRAELDGDVRFLELVRG
ncbi:MAG: ATP12 family chaperone protein [Alphaproteobacteria bacterium]